MSIKTPKLSVISGAYNAAGCPYFRRSIESVLSQSFNDLEFVICDDGSSDSTYKILKEYERMDSRVKILQNEKNLGLAFALNKCIEHSRGVYIARHDCDDYNAPDRFEKQIRYLDRHTNTAILGTSVYLFDRSGIWGKEIAKRRIENEDFLFNNPYKHGSVMFRRSELVRAGAYSTEKFTVRNEDYELFMRMQSFSVGENLTEPLYYFCEDKEAMRRRKYRYRINEARVRYCGFKKLGLMPRGYIYVLKPLAVGLIPRFILRKIQNRHRTKANERNL